MRTDRETADLLIAEWEIDRDWSAIAASAVGLVFSVGTLTLYSFGVFIHPLVQEFGWSRGQLSAAVAIGQYAFALSSLLWGVLLDRLGPRATILPAVVGLGFGFASLSLLTPHLWHFYLVFAIVPFLAGAASPLGYAAVLVRRFSGRLGLALGLALMGVGLGAALLPPLAQSLVTSLGWRAAYGILGAITLVLTFPAAMVATRNTHGPAAHIGNGPRSSVFPLLGTRAFILISLCFILLGTASVGTLAHLIPMMTDRGFSPAAAARIAGITGVATLVSRSGIGWLLDRLHAPYVLGVVSLVATGSGLLLLYGRGSLSSYFAAVFLGVVAGAEVDFIAFLVRSYFGPAVFGHLYGIAFGIFIVGSGTGPLLMGYSFDRFHQYRQGLIFFVVLELAAAAVTLAMPSYGRYRLENT